VTYRIPTTLRASRGKSFCEPHAERNRTAIRMPQVALISRPVLKCGYTDRLSGSNKHFRERFPGFPDVRGVKDLQDKNEKDEQGGSSKFDGNAEESSRLEAQQKDSGNDDTCCEHHANQATPFILYMI
jgi:hypothetical protein